ncbi:MAG TPA: protocatechuate 3,4-dioxygenase subunit alpha [Candidatus Dormibacteraeota bacterium]|nr:protocatechuate 3,4-dioxygenase subunit alpha [Candidatus Dormibacteraeota bacterium]
MSAPLTPSQTVGPFFGVGLPFERGEQIAAPGSAGLIRIEGQVLDGNGDAVPDALLEIWQPDGHGRYRTMADGEAAGFGRCRTDPEGAFIFLTAKPGPTPAPDGQTQAPHCNVTVFARGLLRHLVTRMYFPDETAANATDPVLNLVEPARRETLIAKNCGGVLHFDVRLQGERETVFFAI